MTFLSKNPGFVFVGAWALISAIRSARRPPLNSDVPRRGQVRGVDLAAHLGALGVDRAVGELRHLDLSYPQTGGTGSAAHLAVGVVAGLVPASASAVELEWGVVVKLWIISGVAPV